DWYKNVGSDKVTLLGETIGTVLATAVLGPVGFIIGAAATAATAASDVKTITAARSLANLDPITPKLRTQLDQHPVETSGIELRLAAVALRNGSLRFVDQHRNLLERDGARMQVPDAAKALTITGQILRTQLELDAAVFDSALRARFKSELVKLEAQL